MTERLPSLRVSLTLAVASALLLPALFASNAGAHGKEVKITLRCSAPDASAPLERLCEATVVYAGDGEPATDAELRLSAVRPGKDGTVSGVRLSPEGAPGDYAGSVVLPAYGNWLITVEVEKPAEGEVRLEQEVLPPSGVASPASQVEVRLVQSFDLRDVLNLVFLALHLLGAAGVLAVNGAVVLIGKFVEGPSALRLRRSVVRFFAWGAAASFAVLAMSGAYNALYNSPTRSPGLLEPGRIESLPFGDAYLLAFAVKMALAAAMLAGTALLAVRLREAPAWSVLPVAGGTRIESLPGELVQGLEAGVASRGDALPTLGALNLAVGGVILVLVLVMDYLHLLSHASALLERG